MLQYFVVDSLKGFSECDRRCNDFKAFLGFKWFEFFVLVLVVLNW